MENMFKKALILGGIFMLFAMLMPVAGEAIIIKDKKWNNMSADGFGDFNNVELMKMARNNKKLFVATYNDGTGAEIWRTADGVNWTQINKDGFGDANNIYASALAVWKGKLWVATHNEETGTELWKWDKGEWKQKNYDGFGSEHNISTNALEPFRGRLHAFVEKDNGKGTALFRTKYSRKKSWKRPVDLGLVEDDMALSKPLVAKRVRKTKKLYVGGDGNYVYESDNGKDWQVVNANSAGEKGWGESGNRQITAMDAKNGKLFVGTSNPRNGAQLWRYFDGVWQQRGGDGLGDPENAAITSFQVRKLKGRKYLFAGLENDNGLKIFRTRGGKKWYQMNLHDGFGYSGNTTPHDLQMYKRMLFVTVNDSIWATDFSNN